jgi:hypothetical protein
MVGARRKEIRQTGLGQLLFRLIEEGVIFGKYAEHPADAVGQGHQFVARIDHGVAGSFDLLDEIAPIAAPTRTEPALDARWQQPLLAAAEVDLNPRFDDLQRDALVMAADVPPRPRRRQFPARSMIRTGSMRSEFRPRWPLPRSSASCRPPRSFPSRRDPCRRTARVHVCRLHAIPHRRSTSKPADRTGGLDRERPADSGPSSASRRADIHHAGGIPMRNGRPVRMEEDRAASRRFLGDSRRARDQQGRSKSNTKRKHVRRNLQRNRQAEKPTPNRSRGCAEKAMETDRAGPPQIEYKPIVESFVEPNAGPNLNTVVEPIAAQPATDAVMM